MIGYLRIGGAILVMIAAAYGSYSYEKYINRRLEEYKGLVALVSHAESKISSFLSHGRGLWQGFSNEALESVGLLPALRNGESLSSAFESCLEKMSLSASAKTAVSEKLKGLGEGYMERELKILQGLGEHLSAELEAETEKGEKNVKVARALLLGGGLAVMILAL